VIKGGIIAIKSSRNQAFTGIISFSAGSLNSGFCLTKPVFMGFVGLFCWLYGSISGQLYSEKYISGHRKIFFESVSGVSIENGLAIA